MKNRLAWFAWLIADLLYALGNRLHRNNERSCRECGCVDWNACMTMEGPCCWIEPDLCSGCGF